jgi:glycerophosphoryl diester phosphodiesterase
MIVGAVTAGAMPSGWRPGGSLPAKQVAAHRGFHDGVTPFENTIGAYRRAILLGADLMETDVRRTVDGVLVLHHDATIRGVAIARTRFADLPLLPSGERVSTLRDLVSLTASFGHTRLMVETKEHGYERQVLEVLRGRLRVSQYDLFSFDVDSVRALRELAPNSRVGLLVGLQPDWHTGHWPIRGAEIVAKARSVGADFVALSAQIATNDRLQAIADAGLRTAVWTVDEKLEIQRFLADVRVQTIITNAPDLAMALRDRARRRTVQTAA